MQLVSLHTPAKNKDLFWPDFPKSHFFVDQGCHLRRSGKNMLWFFLNGERSCGGKFKLGKLVNWSYFFKACFLPIDTWTFVILVARSSISRLCLSMMWIDLASWSCTTDKCWSNLCAFLACSAWVDLITSEKLTKIFQIFSNNYGALYVVLNL